MLRKVLAAGMLVSITLLGGLFLTTTPSTTGPFGILIFFVLMYTSALCVLTFLLYGLNRIVIRATRTARLKSTIETISFQKAYYYASVVALAPVMLIAMQSVSHIGFYQFLLVIFFVVIAWIYVAKRTT